MTSLYTATYCNIPTAVKKLKIEVIGQINISAANKLSFVCDSSPVSSKEEWTTHHVLSVSLIMSSLIN